MLQYIFSVFFQFFKMTVNKEIWFLTGDDLYLKSQLNNIFFAGIHNIYKYIKRVSTLNYIFYFYELMSCKKTFMSKVTDVESFDTNSNRKIWCKWNLYAMFLIKYFLSSALKEMCIKKEYKILQSVLLSPPKNKIL